jgi:probable F420-dependent oxidoreductase
MADHFGDQLAIGPALAVVAEATTTLRIGTLVWQNDLRHPTILAMEAASLDLLSNGRFELGIGAGGSFRPEFGWTGIPFAPAAERVSRLEESVQVIKGVTGPEPFSFSGNHYSIREYNGRPKPVQASMPLLIGGGGPRMLSLAAREADIVALFPRMLPAGGFAPDENDMDTFARKATFVRDAAGERGPRLEFNILTQMIHITDDRESTIRRLKSEHGIEDDAWFDSPMVYVGSVDEICSRMRTVRDRTGVSYFVVFEPAMEDAAPIVRELAGT